MRICSKTNIEVYFALAKTLIITALNRID